MLDVFSIGCRMIVHPAEPCQRGLHNLLVDTHMLWSISSFFVASDRFNASLARVSAWVLSPAISVCSSSRLASSCFNSRLFSFTVSSIDADFKSSVADAKRLSASWIFCLWARTSLSPFRELSIWTSTSSISDLTRSCCFLMSARMALFDCCSEVMALIAFRFSSSAFLLFSYRAVSDAITREICVHSPWRLPILS